MRPSPELVVLCYGDSNTFGTTPGTGERLSRTQRWPGVLQTQLGSAHGVIEEGLGGRTTVWDDALVEHRNGKQYLVPCLESHQPLDVVTIMLGTNDVQTRFAASAPEIASGAGVLAAIARRYASRVLLIAPPPLGRIPADNSDAYNGAAAKIAQLPRLYRAVANEVGCEFFDAGSVIRCSDIDGIHFAAAEHRLLGEALAGVIASQPAFVDSAIRPAPSGHRRARPRRSVQ